MAAENESREVRGTEPPSPKTDWKACFNFMGLPLEIRNQVSKEAIALKREHSAPSLRKYGAKLDFFGLA